MTPLLKIEHLEVRYGDLIGVSDVSLEVPEGSVVALLGSNGGGKTTTLNAIAGLIPSHSGSISFRGEEIGDESAFDRAQGAGVVTGGLAAVRAAERGEQSPARRDAAERQVAKVGAAGARL
jgi:ABC-type branched-subunit amino acid transport system ATPase component